MPIVLFQWTMPRILPLEEDLLVNSTKFCTEFGSFEWEFSLHNFAQYSNTIQDSKVFWFFKQLKITLKIICFNIHMLHFNFMNVFSNCLILTLISISTSPSFMGKVSIQNSIAQNCTELSGIKLNCAELC